MTSITEQPDPAASRIWALVFLLPSLIVGLGVYLVTEHLEDPALEFGIGSGLLLGLPLLLLSIDKNRWRSAGGFALGLGLLIALLGATALMRFNTDFDDNATGLYFALAVEAIVFAYIALPFVQTWQDQGALSFPYHRLFFFAWNNGLIGLVALAFAGLFWIILWLFAALFEAIGITALKDLIEEAYFAWPATTTAFGLGVYIARDYSRIVAALRAIVFSLLSVLAPVFLVLAVSFLIALAAGGFEELSSVISASGTLLVLMAVGVTLANAVFRDGSEYPEPNRMLSLGTMVLIAALLGFAGFAVYAIAVRIDQYGLTPERIWIAVGTATLSAHCLLYTLTFVRPKTWMARSRRMNIYLAGVVAALAVLLQTPLLDPYRLSAESQHSRLVSGEVDAADFDYGFLKFKLGSAGREVLVRLRNDSGQASAEVVSRNLNHLAGIDSYWAWRSRNDSSDLERQAEAFSDRNRIIRVPSDLEIPDDLLSTVRIGYSTSGRCGTDRGQECLITSIDITDGIGEEFVFVAKTTSGELAVWILERRGSTWHQGVIGGQTIGESLWDALLKGEVTTVPADHRDLKIGDQIFRLKQPWVSMQDGTHFQ